MQPLLPSISRGGEPLVLGEQAVRVTWAAGERRLVLDANLSSAPVAFPETDARPFWSCGESGAVLGPWTVRWGLTST